MPIGKFHFGAGLKEQRKLPAFRPKPQAIFTAKSIHVRVGLFQIECFIFDPSEAFVKTLEAADYTRILVEVGAECPLPVGALMRGEKPHTVAGRTICTAMRSL